MGEATNSDGIEPSTWLEVLMPVQPERFPALDGLRGIAAVGVMMTHYAIAEQVKPNFFIANGSWGVLMFFAISGFIIAHVYAKVFAKRVTARDFWHYLGLRFAKLYPLHLALLLVFVGVILPLHMWGPDANNNDTTYLLNVFMLHGWGFWPVYSWNTPSWSVSIEWLCYLLFPALCVVRWLRAPLAAAAAMVLLLASLKYYWLVGWLAWAAELEPTLQLSGGLMAAYYFQIFALGYFAYCLRPLVPPLSPPVIDLLVFASCALIWLCDMRPDLMPAFSVAFVFFLSFEGRIARAFSNPVAVYLGRISYSLYMTHIMFYAAALTIWANSGAAGRPHYLVLMVAATATAMAVFHLFEEPMRLRIRAWVNGLGRSARKKFPLPVSARGRY